MRRSFVAIATGLVVLIVGVGSPTSADGPAGGGEKVLPSRRWFPKELAAMKEPDLRELARKDRAATIYRFLWYPSFHDVVSVRFVKTGEGAVVDAVKLKLADADARFAPVRVVARRSARLKPVHWQRIADRVEKAKFWTMPTTVPLPSGVVQILDGDRLIVEGVRMGAYHRVMRHSPRRDDFVELCQAMLFMSGINLRAIWFDYHECAPVARPTAR